MSPAQAHQLHLSHQRCSTFIRLFGFQGEFFAGFFFLARCFAERRQGGVCQHVTIVRSFQIAPTIFHLLSHQGSEAESEREEWSPSISCQAVTLR